MADLENTTSELSSFAQRIERLRGEKRLKNAEYAEDIKNVWAEAKGRGYGKKALEPVLKLRDLSSDDRAMVSIYADRLGVFE